MPGRMFILCVKSEVILCCLACLKALFLADMWILRAVRSFLRISLVQVNVISCKEIYKKKLTQRQKKNRPYLFRRFCHFSKELTVNTVIWNSILYNLSTYLVTILKTLAMYIHTLWWVYWCICQISFLLLYAASFLLHIQKYFSKGVIFRACFEIG